MPMPGPHRSNNTNKIAEFGGGDLVIGSVKNVIYVRELESKPLPLGAEAAGFSMFHVVMFFSAVTSVDVLLAQALRVRGYLVNRHWFEKEGF